jgi:hypothetical protein
MLLNQPDSHGSMFDPFDDFSKYEKGVVARAFLETLVSQGYLASHPSDGLLGKVVISVNQWQLQLLDRFSKEGELAEEQDEIVPHNLDQIC